MQTAPRPYGGDIERSLCKRYRDRTVATSNGLRVPSSRGPRSIYCEFLLLEEAHTKVTLNGLRVLLSLNIILSEDSLRRCKKESTRTTMKWRTDSSRYIFI